MDMLDHAVMRSDGHFWRPRNGEVAIQNDVLKHVVQCMSMVV